MDKRIFLGFALNQQQQQDCLKIQQAIWASNKPVKAQNLHLTVLFIGQLNALQLNKLSQYLDEQTSQQQFARFDIEFDRLIHWQKPQIIALGARLCPPALLHIHQSLGQFATSIASPVANQRYLPHITLFRKAKQHVAYAVNPVVLQPACLHLFESKSTPNGVEYISLANWDLTP
ncbi:RNA 2',3'-cyclic phosphodiesterase [Shewanella waksmanii]|uniref:RNA 2',3'-cyclic phosphodiesterase n=1 Tax=Shewanella waksmanii TaxID=213783 RepID=UPI003734CA7D